MPAYRPVTDEFVVNSSSAGDQIEPAVRALGSGNFVVVWTDENSDRICAQLFSPDGLPIGTQFDVSTEPAGFALDPEVVPLEHGGFAVVWSTHVLLEGGGGHSDVLIRFFDSNGTPIGAASPVHPPSTTNQNEPGITALADGTLLVTWHHYSADQSDLELWCQRIGQDGAPIGEAALVTAGTEGIQANASVAPLPDGGFVVAWNNWTGGPDGYEILARLFDAEGNGGPEFPVNTRVTSHQMFPSVAAQPDGSFMICWHSHATTPSGDDWSVFAQRFTADGSRAGFEFEVPNITAGLQVSPEIEALSAGQYLVTWTSIGTDGSGSGVYGRIVNAAGNVVGEQYPLHTHTDGDQDSARHTSIDDSNFVVVWRSAGSDEDGLGISARIFTTADQDARNDFNGDGRSDVLWRSDGGTLSNWLGQTNGGFSANDGNALVSGLPASWQVVGTGDFNGDGRDDLLWRSDTGGLSNWLGTANGGWQNNDANAFANVSIDWQATAVGDFNGDGKDDVLWRSDAGQMSNWLGTASGGWSNNDANAFTQVSTNWQVVAAGDFNGDGRDDILWRSDTGQMSNWLGTASGGFANNDANAFANVSTSWKVLGVGDFNGDGKDDVLWRSDMGAMSNWLAQANGGLTPNDANAFINVSLNWHIAQIGDFNGDGRDDILWRSDAGAFSNWLGTASGGWQNNDANAYNNVPTVWHVQAPDIFWL